MNGRMIEFYEEILSNSYKGGRTMIRKVNTGFGNGKYSYEVGWTTSPFTQTINADSEEQAKSRFLDMYHSGRIGRVTVKKVSHD
jgi:hypothetical protein